jgi:hypothetical protein
VSRFTRDEIEQHWAHYQDVARRCGPAGDWDEFCDLYTEDCTMVVSGAGRIGGREAMKRWYREAFGSEPMRWLVYYPVEWYMIDEHRGWVACEFKNRMADPGDGSVHEFSCFSLLKYAGNGLWSYEEDKLDPAEMADVLEGWHRARAALAPTAG